jgi:putative FmdB family regulatory protein
MPHYDFQCKKCETVYDEIVSYDEKGKYPTVKCPKCGSKKKDKLLSQIGGVMFSKPQESSKWDNFEYRAGYNMDKAQGERRAAEAASHMGANPYSHSAAQIAADINNDANYGEVK